MRWQYSSRRPHHPHPHPPASTDPAPLRVAQEYLHELMHALSKAPRWGGGVVHADPLVVNQLSAGDQDDNFLVYAVASEVMRQATYHYTIDRCDKRALCEADDPGGLASMTRLRDELQASRMQRAHQQQQQQQSPAQ